MRVSVMEILSVKKKHFIEILHSYLNHKLNGLTQPTMLKLRQDLGKVKSTIYLI